MSAVVLSEYVPAVVIDPYGEVYDMNAEAEKLLGDSRVNLVNKPWDRPLKDGAVIDVDGRSVQLSVMKTTLASYVTLNDLSLRQQSSAQAVEIDTLQGDLKKAQELLAVKEKFTALIAHDFGTPITGIRLQNDILKNHLATLLGFVLDHAPVESVTIELDDTDEQTIIDQINIMRSYLSTRV